MDRDGWGSGNDLLHLGEDLVAIHVAYCPLEDGSEEERSSGGGLTYGGLDLK